MVALSSKTSVDAPAGQIMMPRGGRSGLQKSRRMASTSRGLSSIRTPETCAGPEAMVVFDVDGNEGDSMSGPEICAINVTTEVLSTAPEASTFNWEPTSQVGFTGSAMSVLNFVKNCFFSVVKYPEHAARVVFLGKTSSREAHRAEISQTRAECEKRVAEVQVISEAKIKVVSTRLETASKENAELVKKLRLIQDTSAMEVQRFKTAVTRKDKAMEEVTSERNLLMARCSKVEALIAVIEQRAALDSTSSGSYADDRANPSILQDVACKSVDKATDALTKILHQNSITNRRDSEERLDLFVRAICPAKLVDFARPLHVKYVWSYRICSVMFRGFEHCYFDIDGGQLTSPLDAKLHASKSFECFQLNKALPSFELYETCAMFRAFCSRKYAELFPPDLLKGPMHSLCPHDNIRIDISGRFRGDAHIFDGFLDVAKAVWLLHKLAFAFDPPVSILRMAYGEAFDNQFHESAVIDEDSGGGSSKVVLMIRPGFRVRNTIIRSRVFLANA